MQVACFTDPALSTIFNMKKTVGILTTFGGWDDGYSLCSVVRNQIVMLIKHGYTPVLFTLDIFPKNVLTEFADKLEIRSVLPTIKFEPYQGIVSHRNVPNEFEKDVAKITPVYDQNFKDIDVMLCHDVIFQDSFLAYNAALYKMVLPSKDFWMYHWMHSGPSTRQEVEIPLKYLYQLPPHSTLIYMNSYDTVVAAEMYNTFAATGVRVVHNPIDHRTARENGELTNQIITEFDLNEADIIAVYPLSTTRMGAGGKQLNKAIKIMASLKQLGKKVRMIVANAHANGQNEKDEIEKMVSFAQETGLDPKREIIFTSLINAPQFEHGVSHRVVMDLFTISDVFLFPSVSENCPLALLEAALGKNLLVLNEDFSPMKDFVGPNALYVKFDSVRTTTTHPNGEDVYFFDWARIIISELEASKVYKSHLTIRQKFNLDAVFINELEPLFYEQHDVETDKPPAPKQSNKQIEVKTQESKKKDGSKLGWI